MSSIAGNPLSVFTKPWMTLTIQQLATFVKSLAVDGIELPVRPGFQVEPEKVAAALPAAVRVFAEKGLKIFSIAGPIDARTIDACAASGIKLIRVCLPLEPGGYYATVDQFRRQVETVIPALDRAGVTIGLQNHHGEYVGSAIGLIEAIRPFDRKHVGAVLDVCHCSLAGEPEHVAVEIAWPKLCMMNLKNARRRRIADEAGEARWEVEWIGAKEGFASWSRTARVLKERSYRGPICLTAEYSDPAIVDRQIAADAAYARALLS